MSMGLAAIDWNLSGYRTWLAIPQERRVNTRMPISQSLIQSQRAPET